MSGWDAYVNAMVSGIPEGAAAIYGTGPVGLWFQSPGFGLTADQVNKRVSLVKDPPSDSAFHVADKRFIKLQCEPGFIVRGKSGEYGAAAAVSGKAILICFGKTTPQAVSVSVEKYANDLKSKGF
ncbi:MAG: profilin [Anaerolineae bacterium]|nr:profilin [Anaerolineae bacterium]